MHAGSTYRFQPSASDSDGDALTFSVTGLPAWATFNATTGLLSGTPAAANVGTYAGITISVSDGHQSASLAPFTIQVVAAPSSPPPNSPPTIGGTPATQVQTGQAYSFTPTAQDTDGDALSFSIQNKPSWATFSIATGQLSGTPASGDVGSYADIVISVSDGTTTAALAAFSISVTAPSPPPTSGTVTLDWTQPTTNTDGTPATDLAGYTILYGESPTSLTQSISVANPATTTYTFSGLASGTWYFELVADTTDGSQSAPTNPVSATVP